MPEQQTTYYSNDPRLERRAVRLVHQHQHRHPPHRHPQRRLAAHPLPDPDPGPLARLGHAAATARGGTLMRRRRPSPRRSRWPGTPPTTAAPCCAASYNQYVDINIFDLARHTLGGQVAAALQVERTGRQRRLRPASASTRAAPPQHLRPALRPAGLRRQRQRPAGRSWASPASTSTPLGAEREIVQGVALALDFVYKDFKNQYETRETNRIWNGSGTGLEFTGGYRNGRNETINDLGTPDERQPATTRAPPSASTSARAASRPRARTPWPAWRATCSTASTTAGATSPRRTSTCGARCPTTTATR